MPECRLVTETLALSLRTVLDFHDSRYAIVVQTHESTPRRQYALTIITHWPGGLFSQSGHSESRRSHGDYKELHARMIEYAKSLLGADSLWELMEYG